MGALLADSAVALVIALVLIASQELGFLAGRRVKMETEGVGGSQIGAIQGAVLGLLGLLLAFSFSAAGGRFLERQDLITTEANAIGTATLRADLLAEPHRTALRHALRDYTQHRLGLLDQLRYGLQPANLEEIDRLLARIWSTAVAGVNDRPNAMLGVLPPVNDVIDLHSVRLSAARKRIPPLVSGVLVACSLLAMGVMGYAGGLTGRRRAPLMIPLTIVIGASLWITYDLDNPRAGLLQLNDAPLKALKFHDATSDQR